MSYPVVSRGRTGYPPLLAELHDPPDRLYLRGGPASVLAEPSVAVVVARSCSSYGAQVAREISRELAAAGVVVVSGLARGIDGEAHRGALAAGGRTVAVLGCGIDRDYPRAHAHLAGRVAESGAVVSEYPPGVEPSPWRFPARNRIVAGLARATIVVEARERSGALITADFALELGREVFAVPGEITSSLSAGTNDLIRQGATPLLSADDVLGVLGLERPPPRPPADLSRDARALLGPLSELSRSLDELTRATGLDSARIAAALTELELGGLVAVADGVYRPTTGGRSLS
ncbi:MAG TPA: DNA-processing protein DprA [Gaiellaceae bacterium]|nr:DNA-processing protein DprA [Gaiellaceae bacterium]